MKKVFCLFPVSPGEKTGTVLGKGVRWSHMILTQTGFAKLITLGVRKSRRRPPDHQHRVCSRMREREREKEREKQWRTVQGFAPTPNMYTRQSGEDMGRKKRSRVHKKRVSAVRCKYLDDSKMTISTVTLIATKVTDDSHSDFDAWHVKERGQFVCVLSKLLVLISFICFWVSGACVCLCGVSFLIRTLGISWQ